MVENADLPLDFYRIDDLLTERELQVRDRVRSFCDKQVLPIINDYWERAEFPFELVPKLAELGVAGGTIEGYGCPGLSEVATGLVAQELARADGSVCTFFGVHSGLAMQSIALLGSEEQKQRWLPAMARLDKIGAFALTEPQHGSDAVALETRARRDGDQYVLDGAKRWIGNASFADLVIVWARDDDGKVGGFVVDKGTPGFQASVMRGKTAKRAVWQASASRSPTAWPGPTASARPPRCWPRPATGSPGRRSATRWRRSSPHLPTRASASSSARRSPASSSSSPSWPRCSPRSPPCSC